MRLEALYLNWRKERHAIVNGGGRRGSGIQKMEECLNVKAVWIRTA